MPFKLSQQHPELIHTEPEDSFYSLDWTKKGVKNIFENYVELGQSNYSLHLWSHLWWSKERIDYTTFHAGKITESYVRFAQTTFSTIARKFLPPECRGNRWVYLIQSKFGTIDRYIILIRNNISRKWLFDKKRLTAKH